MNNINNHLNKKHIIEFIIEGVQIKWVMLAVHFSF